jgi:hypothetical protein
MSGFIAENAEGNGICCASRLTVTKIKTELL